VITRDVLPTLAMGVDNLFAHKLRSLLTMLGMIFGVAAVVAMLSIGAGAQQQVMAVIEAMGVRNLIVESRPAPDQQAFQRLRQVSPGLTLADMRVIKATVDGVGSSTARKRFTPSKLIPKPFADAPTVFGVEPTFQGIAGLQVAEGRFITAADDAAAAPIAVLGEGARVALFGGRAALGEHVKVNEQWLQVVGVCGSVISAQNGASMTRKLPASHFAVNPRAAGPWPPGSARSGPACRPQARRGDRATSAPRPSRRTATSS